MKNQKLAFGIQTTPFAVGENRKLGGRIFALDGKTWWYQVLSEQPVALGHSAYCDSCGRVFCCDCLGNVGGVALAANLDDQQSESIDKILKNEPAKFNLNYAKFLKNFMIEVDDESNGLTQDERKMLKNNNSGKPVHPTVKLVKETGADGKTRLMPKDLLIVAPFMTCVWNAKENYNENFKNHFIYKVAKIANKVLAKMIDKDIMNVIQPKVQAQEQVNSTLDFAFIYKQANGGRVAAARIVYNEIERRLTAAVHNEEKYSLEQEWAKRIIEDFNKYDYDSQKARLGNDLADIQKSLGINSNSKE